MKMSPDVKYVLHVYIYIFFSSLPLIINDAYFFENIFFFLSLVALNELIAEILAKEFHFINNENNFISLILNYRKLPFL